MSVSILNASPNTLIAASSDLEAKLDADAGAPDFNSQDTYEVGEWVNYNSKLWRCHTAVTSPGNWTGTTNWELRDISTPDATLDITQEKALRILNAQGERLWQQGYNATTPTVSSRAVTLSNEAVNYIAFNPNDAGAITITFPSRDNGKIPDFVLEVMNPALNSSAPAAWSSETPYVKDDTVLKDGKVWICVVNNATTGSWVSNQWQTACIEIAGFESTVGILIPKDADLKAMLTIEPGEIAEFYFTFTQFTYTPAGANSPIPLYKLIKQVLEIARSEN